MPPEVVRVKEASKKFSRSLAQMMSYAPLDVCRTIFGLDRRSGQLRGDEFWAVDKVSFTLAQGERLGLIGRNGSGKSTLLKMLNGILLPDSGSIRIKGRVGALIEIGAGFNPVLTGRENIFVNAAIMGIKRSEVLRRFDEIVAFADIGDFLDSPVKFYSSGMYTRLGFSVAVHAEPDILLIDEVLAVGDYIFQKKCFDHLESMLERGTTIVFVSHSINAVERLCPLTLLLDHGKPVYWGDTQEAAARYYELTSVGAQDTAEVPGRRQKIVHKDVGSKVVCLHDFHLLNQQLQPVQKIFSGEFIKFVVKITSTDDKIERLPRIAIRVIDPKNELLMVNIQIPQRLLREIKLNGDLTLECDVPSFNLAPGVYRLEVKIGGDGEDLHDIAVVSQLLEISWSKDIVDNMSYKGKIYLPGDWRIPQSEPG
ncbi:MAG: hypothetical protein A2Y80_03120 [Deltaproteobacteria bacterium RBG_13_58_19]|nr:MAG: hypothetical protein A2Y80_03120 [Deltaproteobacteria bacterium RBG_13_58_19]